MKFGMKLNLSRCNLKGKSHKIVLMSCELITDNCELRCIGRCSLLLRAFGNSVWYIFFSWGGGG